MCESNDHLLFVIIGAMKQLRPSLSFSSELRDKEGR